MEVNSIVLVLETQLFAFFISCTRSCIPDLAADGQHEGGCPHSCALFDTLRYWLR